MQQETELKPGAENTLMQDYNNLKIILLDLQPI